MPVDVRGAGISILAAVALIWLLRNAQQVVTPFWSWMWGIWSTLLAVTMMMVIKVVCDHAEEFQPIGDVLGE